MSLQKLSGLLLTTVDDINNLVVEVVSEPHDASSSFGVVTFGIDSVSEGNNAEVSVFVSPDCGASVTSVTETVLGELLTPRTRVLVRSGVPTESS